MLKDILLRNLDKSFPAMRAAHDSIRVPAKGWLMAIRQATGIKQRVIANRMGVRQQTYSALEGREETQSISLASLSKAAEALDCELVYFLVPKTGIANSFAKLAALHDPLQKHLQATEHSMALEGQAVDNPEKP